MPTNTHAAAAAIPKITGEGVCMMCGASSSTPGRAMKWPIALCHYYAQLRTARSRTGFAQSHPRAANACTRINIMHLSRTRARACAQSKPLSLALPPTTPIIIRNRIMNDNHTDFNNVLSHLSHNATAQTDSKAIKSAIVLSRF